MITDSGSSRPSSTAATGASQPKPASPSGPAQPAAGSDGSHDGGDQVTLSTAGQSALASQSGGHAIDPQAIHMVEYRDSTYNPDGLPSSADCGPTATAMGLKALGLQPPGLGTDFHTDNAGWIDATRFAMYSDGHGNSTNASQDGVASQNGVLVRNADGTLKESQGSAPTARSNGSEHLGLTGLDNVKTAAQNSGAVATDVKGMDQVQAAVSNGQPVVLEGNPNAPGAYGKAHNISYNGGHFILVSGYDNQSHMYTINDPLSHKGPFEVTPQQLAAFGATDGVKGVALSRADGQPVGAATAPGNGVPTPQPSTPAVQDGTGGVPSPQPSTPAGQNGTGMVPTQGMPATTAASQGTDTGTAPNAPGAADHASGAAGQPDAQAQPQDLDSFIATVAEAVLSAHGAETGQLQGMLFELLMMAQGSGVQLQPQTEQLVGQALSQGGGVGRFVSQVA